MDATLGRMRDIGRRMDDLSRVSEAIEFSNDGYSPVTERVDGRYGIGFSQQLRERGAGRMIGAMARETGRQAARRGDHEQMYAAYIETGITGSGSAADMANQPGRDSCDAIELGRYTGEYPALCGPADAYGRCASQFHDMGCSHSVEGALARGETPEASDRWRQALKRGAGQAMIDADGRVWRDQHGNLVTARGHIEALTGQRAGRSPFVSDPSHGRELTAPQRVNRVRDTSADPGSPEAFATDMPGATVARAARLAAGLVLATSADHASQRQAWRAEEARRTAERDRRTGGRVHMDYGESPRERAQRLASRPGHTCSATTAAAACSACCRPTPWAGGPVARPDFGCENELASFDGLWHKDRDAVSDGYGELLDLVIAIP